MGEFLYPTKYAVMPVTQYALEDMVVIGFVVTKAYVVSEYIRYTNQGKKVSYDIVYPLKGLKTAEVSADLRVPEFDMGGRCVNADHNNDVFDTFDEAKRLCTEKNNALFRADIAHYTERTNAMQEFELKLLERTFSVPNPEDTVGKVK